MNTVTKKLVLALVNRYKAAVQSIREEKLEIIKEAQEKIDGLNVEYIKQKIERYEQPGK